jgi:hypothetical protein
MARYANAPYWTEYSIHLSRNLNMSVTLHLRIENQGLNRKVDLQFFAYSNNFFESLSKKLELPNTTDTHKLI